MIIYLLDQPISRMLEAVRKPNEEPQGYDDRDSYEDAVEFAKVLINQAAFVGCVEKGKELLKALEAMKA